MQPEAPRPSFRGRALSGCLTAARELAPEEVARVMDAHASAALRDTLASLDPSAWYPAEAHLELVELLHGQALGGDPQRMHEAGRRAVEEDLCTVYRDVVRCMSPSFALDRTSKLLARYVNYAHVDILARDAFTARVKVTLSPANEALWHAIAGTLRASLEYAGAIAVRLESEGPTASSRIYALAWT